MNNLLDGKKIAGLAVFITVIAVAFFAGIFVGEQKESYLSEVPFLEVGNAIEPEGIDFSPLWTSWNIIEEKFVAASSTVMVTNEEKVWGAIQGLTRSLNDPYTVFLPPEDTKMFEQEIQGNFEGVGMEIGIRDDALTVIAPLEGTPADRAGVQSGDKIVQIDGQLTDGITIERAVKRIRGERGTKVVLTVLREGESELLTIEIVRDVIEIPTIDTQIRNKVADNNSKEVQGPVVPDDVFVIKLHNFSAISPNLFRNALREFVESGLTKLIIDLRGNPGGFLEAAVDMASWFLPTGKVVVTEDFGEKEKPRIHRSKGYNIFNENLKLIILVDQGSASASEIFAGALREHGIATLVGMQTFGKGSVQELVSITKDTSLKVTVARWLTPNGISISDGGLTPNVVVEVTQEDIEAGLDPQLEKSVELLKE